jgi:DNA-directed RNA polymerase specialized sigma24 family protein
MALSEPDLLVAAQKGDPPARQELLDRFGSILFYFAGRACSLVGLDPSETEDVVQATFVALLNPDTAPFDPDHPRASWQSYLRGLVQNAARTHTNFVRHEDEMRHDYTDPVNIDRDLPRHEHDIPDTRADGETITAARRWRRWPSPSGSTAPPCPGGWTASTAGFGNAAGCFTWPRN